MEASWERLGAVLGPSWGHLGRSWAVLGRSWAVLGLPRGSWRGFGSHRGAVSANRKNHRKTIGFSTILAFRGPSGGVLGVSWAILGAPRAILEASQGPSETLCDHPGNVMRHPGRLGPSWTGSWGHLGPKNRWEMHQDWAPLHRPKASWDSF